MANNIIDISLLNPVRFVNLGGTFKGFDDDWFTNLIFDFQEQVNYSQKWQKSDTIKIQFYSNFTPITLKLLDGCGKNLTSYTPTLKNTSLQDDNFKVYEVSVPLSSFDTGTYYFVLSVGTSTNRTELISEPFYVDDTIDNSILFTYKNSYNAQGIIFETDIEFQFRCEGVITELQPGFKDTIYQDQILDNVLLKSVPFRQFNLKIGGERGVPDWVVDKVNRVLSCDEWNADDKGFVKKDGTQWTPISLENYPMSGWSIEVLEASNLSSKRGTNDGNPSQQISVVYNIESDLFGYFNDETIQVTQISRG